MFLAVNQRPQSIVREVLSGEPGRLRTADCGLQIDGVRRTE
jgi:hypothetical protein